MGLSLVHSQCSLEVAHLSFPALTCGGEDSNHKADPSVGQQSYLCLVHLALVLDLLGLHGGPNTGAQHHQVEEHHHYQSWDVDGHCVLNCRSGNLRELHTYKTKRNHTNSTNRQLILRN